MICFFIRKKSTTTNMFHQQSIKKIFSKFQNIHDIEFIDEVQIFDQTDGFCIIIIIIYTEVQGSIPGHSLGFFWGSWVWNGVHSASWSDKLSRYLNKEVTIRFGKLKMQLWDSMCWPHVNPVPSGAVWKDCQRRLLSRPRFVRAVAPRIIIIISTERFLAKIK
jgi:hypothetical protein